MLDEDDCLQYEDVELPDNWVKLVFKRTSISDHFNRAFELFPSQPWYALTGDDLFPEKGWDTELSQSCYPDKLAWGDDGLYHKPSHPFIGGKLARAAGWLAPPGFKHLYTDTAWEEISKRLDLQVYRPDIKTTHLHFTNGGEWDKTYEDRIMADPQVWTDFMNNIDRITYRIQLNLGCVAGVSQAGTTA